jgi:hypothetical protein
MTVTTGPRSENNPNQHAESVWRFRLGRCAADVADYGDSLEDSMANRDRLIVEAIGQGCSRGKVSRWARISRARVSQILDRARP